MAIGSLVAILAGLSFAGSAAHREHCVATSTGAHGAAVTTNVGFDLDDPSPLSREMLPEHSSAIACGRDSIVPRPNDVRVVMELTVAFGIVVGRRSLWIWARHGVLQTTLDNGALSDAEKAGLDAWLRVAQARFAAALRH